MVESQEELILKALGNLNIPYEKVTHPPVYTVNEAKAFSHFEGEGCKNLFLYDKKAGKHYLVVMLEDKKAHSNTIRKQVKASSLVFGSEEDLKALLGVTPGSVSPLGIVNDRDKRVTILLDEDLPKYQKLGFHPNTNTATVVLGYNDFERFLKWAGNDIRFISITKE